jgi:hypothetical protein
VFVTRLETERACRLYGDISRGLRRDSRRQIARLSRKLKWQLQACPSFTSQQLRARVSGLVSSSGIPAGADVEELAFVVLMNATNDQDNDLQEIMNEVQAQTNAKQFIRQQMQMVAGDVAAVESRAETESGLLLAALLGSMRALGRRK